jgi:hypothetical protein
MKRILTLFFFGFLSAAALFTCANYHFILTESDGLLVKRKREMSFDQTFVDTRKWGITDYVKHPEIAKHVASKKLNGLLDDADDAKDKASDEAKKLLDSSKKAVGDALESAGEKIKK